MRPDYPVASIAASGAANSQGHGSADVRDRHPRGVILGISPGNVQALAHGMAQMGGWMQSQPGGLGLEPPLLSEDGTCLVGYSRWESKEASSRLASTSKRWARLPGASSGRGSGISSSLPLAGPLDL